MKDVAEAMARRPEPLRLFFRDDDAGWAMNALDRLLAVFAARRCPIDLAVIPAKLDRFSAHRLKKWRDLHGGIGLHQHGYAHLNHEADGQRKCEFGASRPIERQCADVAAGRQRMKAMLGECDAIFTPPWNRCTPELLSKLPGLGFSACSGDRATGAGVAGLSMIPIAVDWHRARREGRLGISLVEAISQSGGPVGIMLHHALFTGDDLESLDSLLGLIAAHDTVTCVPMATLVEEAGT